MTQTTKLATLGEVAAMVTHELARPITNINLKAEFILIEKCSSDEFKNYSQNALNKVKRSNSIISSLFTFGLESNHPPK